MILTCDCKSVGQDMVHGYGKRAHSLSPDGKTATCVVCGAKRSPVDQLEEKKSKAHLTSRRSRKS